MHTVLLLTLLFVSSIHALEIKNNYDVPIPSLNYFAFQLYSTTYAVAFKNGKSSSILTRWMVMSRDNFDKKQAGKTYVTVTTTLGYSFSYTNTQVQSYSNEGGLVFVVENYSTESSSMHLEVTQELNLPVWLTVLLGVSGAVICCVCLTCIVVIIVCVSRRKGRRYIQFRS